ncbi:MAG: ABC transporter ATP-binding protein [Lentisphaeria bacterium]|nr:ABC transporter ATP-binding protein [Lentisphaeria bacterium]
MTEFKLSALFFQYRWMILLSAITAAIFSCLGLTMPLLMKFVIDRVIPHKDYGFFFLLAVIMIAVYTLRVIMRIVCGYLGTFTVTRGLLDVRQRIFKHLQSLSLRFYEEYRTGKLISNVISDVALLQGLIGLSIAWITEFFTMGLITFAVFFLNWKLGLIAMCALPLHFVNFYFSNKRLRKTSRELQEKMSEISANLAETINGIKVVKSFSKERSECRHFFSNMRPTLDLAIKLNLQNNFCYGVFDCLTLITYLTIIGCGISMAGTADFTVGDFVAFYTYIGLQVGPINALAAQMNTLSQGLAGAQRIMKLLKVIPEIKDSPNAKTAKPFKGEIVFDHVSFKYADAPVLKDFSLTIKPGQKVALVGHSGCGKSTIGNLVLRFYDVCEGAIRIDDKDIRSFTQDSYRSQIGVVLQEPFLFSGSIKDNLAYGKPDATMEEIEEAARVANVAEFVEKLENGYNTTIGENGATLSGGQKQRLAIARAVLKNPGILLLDEATSALDTVSEKLVQQALDSLMENRTTIIIAHRLSTIRNADMIVVLKDGVIAQKGTHEELMEQEGTYKDLYETQRKAATEDGGEGDLNHNSHIFYQQHPRALELERTAKKRWSR